MIFPEQIRAARGLLGLSQRKLAERASVSVVTIKRIEGANQVRGAAGSLWKIQSALEAAGVEFIPADQGKGLGVRLTGPTLSQRKDAR